MTIGVIAANKRRNDDGWMVTIAAGEVASNLTNFPVFVDLADMPPSFWSSVDADGGNIRVKQSGSVIPFDLVKIDTGAQTGTLFFLAASLLTASDNEFTLDLTGGGLIDPGDPNGRNDVWAAYDFVCLLDDTNYVDRTGSAAGSLATGSVSASATTGKGAGCGLDFTNARIDFTGRPNRTTFTIGITAQNDASSVASNEAVGSYRNSGAPGGTNDRISFAVRNTTTDYYGQWDNLNSWNPTTNIGYTNVIATTNPRRLHAVYSGTTERRYYTEGAFKEVDSGISENTGVNTYSAGGEDADMNEAWNGRIAYFYARPEALSADFIAAEYSNLNAPASFYTIS